MFKSKINMSIKMKNINYLLPALVFTLLNIFGITFSANAAEGIDNVTIELSTKEVKRGHRIHMPAREKILAHMIKNGVITKEEAKTQRKKRKAQRKELRALKRSGDMDAFKARLAEIKAENDSRRAKFTEYLKNNDDLKIKGHKKRKEHRKHKREREQQEILRENKINAK